MRIRNRYIVARSHSGVGNVSALISEDISYGLKELLSGRFRVALDRISGVIQGFGRR